MSTNLQVVEAIYATGHWLLSSARHADAARVFRFMILTKSDDERGWLALGACHEGLGQLRIALELYRIGMLTAPPAARCALARARVFRLLDADDEAADAFEIARELATGSGDDELARLVSGGQP